MAKRLGGQQRKGEGRVSFLVPFRAEANGSSIYFLPSVSRQNGLAEGSRKIEVAPKPRQDTLFCTPTETPKEAVKQQGVKEKCATLQKAEKRIVEST